MEKSPNQRGVTRPDVVAFVIKYKEMVYSYRKARDYDTEKACLDKICSLSREEGLFDKNTKKADIIKTLSACHRKLFY